MASELDYADLDLLHSDDFSGGCAGWRHEGIGGLAPGPQGGMRVHCNTPAGSSLGCMAFFHAPLPDPVAVEYDLTVLRHGGLVINYLAMRGAAGEDALADAHRLPPRDGLMANYWSRQWGLRSYHVSISRFSSSGEHSGTSNWRRNPGCYLMAHGHDFVRQLDRPYRIRLVKDAGHCALYVDGECAHGFVDRDTRRGAIPDTGHFALRLRGADVAVDVNRFRVFRVASNERVWAVNEVQPEV
jgi:hypothetical protein